jgi:hypothetical protein
MRARRFAVIALAGLVLAGCGGSSRSHVSGRDSALSAAVVRDAASLWQEASPLLVCGPACSAHSLRALQRDAELRSRRAAANAAALETPCLRRGMLRYAESLRGLRDFAGAELSHAERAGIAAINRSDRLRFSAIRLLAGCGYFKRDALVGLVANRAYQRIDAAAAVVDRCKTLACYRRAGRGIERAAALGRAQLAAAAKNLDSPCFQRAVAKAVRLLDTSEAFGRAVRQLDVQAIQRQTRLLGSRQAAVARSANECLP